MNVSARKYVIDVTEWKFFPVGLSVVTDNRHIVESWEYKRESDFNTLRKLTDNYWLYVIRLIIIFIIIFYFVL